MPSTMFSSRRELSSRSAHGRAYLTWLRETLQDAQLYRDAKTEIRAAVRHYVRAHRNELQASTPAALFTLGRTLLAVLAPALAAFALHRAGMTWLGLPLAAVSGMALFGVLSIVHDTVHGSFLPSKGGNRILGSILAPFVLLDFRSFRTSHMAHHRHSQSITKDPKNPNRKIPKPGKAKEGDDGMLTKIAAAAIDTPLMLWYRAAARLSKLPSGPRHAFYLASLFALGLPVVVFFGGEVAFRNRNWRRSSTWLSLAVSVGFPVALFCASPFVAAFYVASLWIAMGLFFGVFLTHMSPYQLYMADENPSVPFFSLNISDIDMGASVELLGNAFTDYHAAHHLMPQVPSYRLRSAGQWVAERFEQQKAPTFRLFSPSGFNPIGDAVIASVTSDTSVLIPWDTVVGVVSRLPLVEPTESPSHAAPASQRASSLAI